MTVVNNKKGLELDTVSEAISGLINAVKNKKLTSFRSVEEAINTYMRAKGHRTWMTSVGRKGQIDPADILLRMGEIDVMCRLLLPKKAEEVPFLST